MRINKINRIICLMLSAILLVASVPSQVYASEMDESKEFVLEEINEETGDDDNAEIIDFAGSTNEEISTDEVMSTDEDTFTEETLSDVEIEEFSQEEIYEEELCEDELLGEEVLDEEILEEEIINQDSVEEVSEEETSLELPETIEGETEGTDYEEGTVYTVVDSLELAEEIAGFYDITLESYECMVAVYRLPAGVSVAEIVHKSENNEEGYPALCPNHYGSVSDTVFEETGNDEDMELDSYVADEYYGTYSDMGYLDEDQHHIGKGGETYSVYPWYLEAIGAPYAWTRGVNMYGEAKTIRGKGVKVAILSGGITWNNTYDVNDFVPLGEYHTTNKIIGHYYIPGSSSDSDLCLQNGYSGGTMIAKVLGAELNNYGYVGVAPECQLYNVKITKDDKTVVEEVDLVKAINYVNNNYDADIMVIDARFNLPIKASIETHVGGSDVTYHIEDTINKAYEKGTTIFAPAASSAQGEAWPAAYPHVIAVGATNQSNQKSWTTGNGKVDIAAPGELIAYSSGTLAAAAIAAGEAALILSAKSEIKALQDEYGAPLTGSSRVDALTKYMKSNTISAGDGCGSGIVYLPKALKLTTIASAPTTPKIIEDGGLYLAADGQLHYRFRLEDDYFGVDKFYYTVNGKKPSFKNGMKDQYSKEWDNAGIIDTVIDGNMKNLVIKAIAVDSSRGTSSAIATKTIPLKTLSQITITAPSSKLLRGKSLQCTAKLVPNNSYTKGVTWHVGLLEVIGGYDYANEQAAKDNGVTISSSGKVTANKKYSGVGIFRVWAVSKKDNSMGSNTIDISVSADINIKSLSVEPTRNPNITRIPSNESSRVVSDVLPFVYVDYSDGTRKLASETPKDFLVTSSNTKVMTVSNNNAEGRWSGEAKAPGTTKITITDAYGKGIKTSYTCIVKKVAESISVVGPQYVAKGKSITLKAQPYPAHATISDIKWRIEEGTNHTEVTDGSIKIQNGKVILSKNVKTGKYYIFAEAKNSDVPGTTLKSAENFLSPGAFRLWVEDKPTKLSFFNKKDKNVTIFSRNNNFGSTAINEKTVEIKLENAHKIKDSPYTPDLTCFSVVSSNENIVKVTGTETDNYGTGRLKVKVQSQGKTGTATITVKSLDGGGAKLSFKVKVVNPVSSVRIAPAKAGADLSVAQGKSLKLKAIIGEEYGKVSNNKVTWSLYEDDNGHTLDPANYVTINPKSGVLTARKKFKDEFSSSTSPFEGITVVATAADGSGAYYMCSVKVYADYGKLTVCDAWGKTAGADGKALKPQGEINVNTDNEIEFFIKIKNSNHMDFNGEDFWNIMSISSSKPSLITITPESCYEWGLFSSKPWNAYVEQSEGKYDYVVYHFVARVVDPSALKKKSEKVKLTIKTLDGSQKLDYTLTVKK